MRTSAREGLLVDGAGAALAEEDSGTVELPDGKTVPYRAIAPTTPRPSSASTTA